MLDFGLYRRKGQTLCEIAKDFTLQDLPRLLDALYDHIEGQIAGASDAEITFVPQDPSAHDPFAADPAELKLPWTLGHVIVHLTASAEEATAQATNLARGVQITGRSRCEVPWRTVTTIEQVRIRLHESRRMQHALLKAWPDVPHLELVHTPGYPGAEPRNAITYFISGLAHADSHLDQIDQILAQARSTE